MGDRDYGAEYSTGFLDSIAIVVVIRTLILSLWNCVYVYARRLTLLQCIPPSKKMPARNKERNWNKTTTQPCLVTRPYILIAAKAAPYIVTVW